MTTLSLELLEKWINNNSVPAASANNIRVLSATRLLAAAREGALSPPAQPVEGLIPTTWLDPLLTGPNAVIGKPPYDCNDIERLLQAIKARIENTSPNTREQGWIYLPVITPEIESELEGSGLIKDRGWTQDAVDFVAVLNNGRSYTPPRPRRR